MTKRIHGTIEFQSLSAKILVFHLVGPFRIGKRPFLGPSFLGTLSRDLCARISNHTNLKKIIIPSLFPSSLPAVPKPPQSEHVIIRLVSSEWIPSVWSFFHQLIPRFFSSLSLTHYCSYPLVCLTEFQTLSAKTLVFHLVGPFRIAKRPFWGLDF